MTYDSDNRDMSSGHAKPTLDRSDGRMANDARFKLDGDGAREVLSALRRGWIVIVATAVVVGALALGYSLAQTPKYQACAVLYVTSGTDDNTQSAYQGALASQQRVTSYAKLVNSDSVVQQAIQAQGIGLSLEQAKAALSASSSADTVLLTICSIDSDRTVAENLANSTARAMTSYVARLETPSGGGQPLAKLTLVSPARTGASPVTPKTTRNVALGVIVGIVLGVLFVLARARFSNRVRDENDILKVTETPVLGAIPNDDLLKRRGLIDFSKGGTPAAESFRKLRTNLTFASVDHPPRVLLVTSPIAVEGKTTTAMNLAASLVESGKRVVLVDADLRRPQVNKRSGLIGEAGLTNYLRGDGELADLVQPSKVDNLWILASGPQPPNPAELLGTQKAAAALRELAAGFEYVIIDTPPVLPVTDAVVLSQWTDGILLVARSGSTRLNDLGAALEQLAASTAAVVGFVITDAPAAKARYGYYGAAQAPRAGLFNRQREQRVIEEVLEPASGGKS